MTSSTSFGPLTASDIIEEAAVDTLRTWFPAYLGQAARDRSLDQDFFPAPRSYTIVNELQQFPEDQLPAVVVVAPGENDEPRQLGDGTMIESWTLGVAAVVSAKDQESTNRLAKLYAKLARAIILHHKGLGGVANTVTARPISYDEGPPRGQRTLAVGYALFTVQVEDALTVRPNLPAVPLDPDPRDPYPEPVPAASHSETVTPLDE